MNRETLHLSMPDGINFVCKNRVGFRGVLKTLQNINDGAFLRK